MFQLAWHPSRPGEHTVKIGVFGPDWQVAYFWDNNAGTFSVR